MYRMIYDHTKHALERVSSDVKLFMRELKKAMKILLPYEIENLVKWLYFFTSQKPELKSCLAIVLN
jgi:DNA replication protein DnaD